MDFFSNILKNTATKVETLTKSATAAVSSSLSPSSPQGGDLPEESNVTGENGAVVTESSQDKQKMARSGSGDTDGPDDEEQTNQLNEEAQDDSKHAFNSAEMSQKALESAKYFGNFLFNVANKAGQTVSATAKQIKSTVESVGIMQEFTKEQQDFIKEHGGKTDLAEPPWVGCEDEEKVKTEILGLSQDKRNFVRSPPGGVEFSFDMTASFPVALALLREDPELSKMRYEIVPKLVNEETFWRNYFYRVSLIKQDPNFTTASDTNKASFSRSSSSASDEGPDDPNDPSLGETEFVSDAFNQRSITADDVRRDMAKLGIHKSPDDLDEELAKDLQEFEVVTGSDSGKIDEDEINRELENFEHDMK